MSEPEMHPVQTRSKYESRQALLTSLVTLKAYEVYSHVYSPQPALVDLAGRNCRGGFSTGELIAFLYAASFPKAEWRTRVDEALQGSEHL